MNPQQLDEALYRAATHHQSGQLAEAAALYTQVLALVPNSAVANHNLGVLAMQTGKGLATALPLFRAAWQADPNHQQHWLSYLRALVQSGDFDGAHSAHQDGTRRGLRGPDIEMMKARMAPARPQPPAQAAPASPAPLADLRQEQAQLERLLHKADAAGAEQLARALTLSHPQHPLGWQGLGTALLAQSRDRDALAALERAAQLAPRDVDTLTKLGAALLRLGLSREAEVAYRRALAVHAQSAPAQLGLAQALLKLYRYADAADVARSALSGSPGSAHLLLGEALLGLNQNDATLASYQEAMRLCPGDVHAYQKLGALLYDRQDQVGMESLARQMLIDAPEYVQAWSDLGGVLMAGGRLAEAAQAFRRALQLRPDDLATRESFLFCSHYIADQSPQAFLDEARVYGRYASQAARPFRQWHCANAPQKLRVGLVSGDLREHPVAYFLEGLLTHADRQRVEWLMYSTSAQIDATTARLQRSAAQWRSLVGLDAEQSARQIHADGVHLLIDLAGHSALNALPAFAWRPAPVQLSWLGYFATTGLSEMDFLLADACSIPASQRQFFSETIVDLPETRLCFSAPQAAPEVAPLPVARKGYLTFGSFQALRKVNDEVLSTWAQVLDACPGARLRVQASELTDGAAQSAFRERAERLGIAAGRITLHGQESRAGYLESHAEVDILLDSFPFPGGTTTCEALWMGVPTVTLNGNTMIGRQGACMLQAAGLPDWIAHSRADYVALAQAKAADVTGLSELRRTLRERLPNAALFDASRFASHFVDALWAMWKQRKY